MLFAALILLFITAGTRLIASLLSVNKRSATLMGAFVGVAFVLGLAVRPALIGMELPAAPLATPCPQPAPTPAAVSVAIRPPQGPPLFNLTPYQLIHLRAIAKPRALGYIDTIGTGNADTPGHRFAPSATVVARGWTADPVTRKPATGLFFIIDKTLRVDVSQQYGTDRPDLLLAFPKDKLEYAGFSGAVIPLAGLAPGKHEVQFGAVSADGLGYYLSRVAQYVTVLPAQ